MSGTCAADTSAFLCKLTTHRLVDYLPEDISLFVRTMQIDIPDRVRKATEARKAGIIYERPTIIGAMLDSELTPEDKAPARIADEALAVVGAGVSFSCLSSSINVQS